MTLLFIISSLAAALLSGLSKTRRGVVVSSAFFYAVQLLFVIHIAIFKRGETFMQVFEFDNLGMAFHMLMAVVSPLVFFQSISYLDREALREFKLFNISLIALCFAVTAVYYANNAVVTWVFLETTTLATAGLVYHRRTMRSLEATWKYVFISSVGIAIAYLGILMLSTAVTSGEGGLSYAEIARSIAGANPLYMKLAFLFILTGYSCKMEIFPMFAVGVDANYVAPTPASALISTALVNAGFVAIFRIYSAISPSEIFPWAKNVMILAGIVSVLVGAVYLRRTNNYKRFLSYSTVENMGIVAIGLGIGGAGVFAAILHTMMHTLVKSSMFLQTAQIGKLYGTYRMNRTGGYFNVYRGGAAVAVIGMIFLLAFPPSGLFVSEIVILKEMMAQGRWWLLALFVILICIIVYTMCRRFAALVLRPSERPTVEVPVYFAAATWMQMGLLAAVAVIGITMPRFIMEFINSIFIL